MRTTDRRKRLSAFSDQESREQKKIVYKYRRKAKLVKSVILYSFCINCPLVWQLRSMLFVWAITAYTSILPQYVVFM